LKRERDLHTFRTVDIPRRPTFTVPDRFVTVLRPSSNKNGFRKTRNARENGQSRNEVKLWNEKEKLSQYDHVHASKNNCSVFF